MQKERQAITQYHCFFLFATLRSINSTCRHGCVWQPYSAHPVVRTTNLITLLFGKLYYVASLIVFIPVFSPYNHHDTGSKSGTDLIFTGSRLSGISRFSVLNILSCFGPHFYSSSASWRQAL
ncbi:hypothetical protein H9L39_01483 [Fusarium oxysporum f. sp. albedinis]|nr:hypothetical protein H9L39_01483 [Fusarium oxysporum f. sp. albedinis]